jgi:hypothetical protein
MAGAAARPHDRSVLDGRAGAPACSPSSTRSRWKRSTCWAAAAPRWSAPTRGFGLALAEDEIEYLVDGVPRPGPQPHRRRADDVRAGQQRALPAQDLQRRVHHRRAAQPASLFGMIRHTHKQNPQHTVIAYSDNASVMEGSTIEALPAGAATCRGTTSAASALTPRADEGRDAQPPDRHLPVPGRLDRRRRRDPRRRRHRPRFQAQGGPDRLLGLAPGRNRATTASPSTSPARCRS